MKKSTTKAVTKVKAETIEEQLCKVKNKIMRKIYHE